MCVHLDLRRVKGLREALPSWDYRRKGSLGGPLGSPLSSQRDGVGKQKPGCQGFLLLCTGGQVNGTLSLSVPQFLYLYMTKWVFWEYVL